MGEGCVSLVLVLTLTAVLPLETDVEPCLHQRLLVVETNKQTSERLNNRQNRSHFKSSRASLCLSCSSSFHLLRLCSDVFMLSALVLSERRVKRVSMPRSLLSVIVLRFISDGIRLVLKTNSCMSGSNTSSSTDLQLKTREIRQKTELFTGRQIKKSICVPI